MNSYQIFVVCVQWPSRNVKQGKYCSDVW